MSNRKAVKEAVTEFLATSLQRFVEAHPDLFGAEAKITLNGNKGLRLSCPEKNTAWDIIFRKKEPTKKPWVRKPKP